MPHKKSPVRKLKLEDIQNWIPVRGPTDNKSHGGRALIWAGSTLMPGASVLAAQSAMRVGAGYVYVTRKETISFFPESLLWSGKSFDKIDSVLIGPGLGIKIPIEKYLKRLRKSSIPVVVDADALTLAAKTKAYPFPQHCIATPHPGELSQFLKISAEEINSDRIRAVRLAQKKLGCTLVLKGHRTLVATDDEIFLIPTGNVALAKGGSGDVLGGILAGLLAQKLTSLHATLLGRTLHGWISDEWIKNGNDYLSLTPSDIVQLIPKALARLRKPSQK